MSKLEREAGTPSNRQEHSSRQQPGARWHNSDPAASCGPFIASLPRGKSAWIAVGPVAYAWQHTLAPQIRSLLENTDAFRDAGVSFFIYMVGRDKSTSSPKIIFCSSDLTARKAIRKSVQESGILSNYSAIGLGDANSPLAKKDSVMGSRATRSQTTAKQDNNHTDQTHDVFSAESQLASQSSNHGLEVLGAGQRQVTQHQGTTLEQQMETLSISNDCPSSLSLEASLCCDASASLHSASRSSDWTPMTSVHDSLDVIPRAQLSPIALVKDKYIGYSDSADERESYSESEDARDTAQQPVMVPAMDRQLEGILKKVLGRFTSRMTQPNTRAIESSGYEQYDHTPKSVPSDSPGNLYGASQVSNGKRPLDTDSADRVAPITSKKAKTIRQASKVFACPFWKKDPLRYSRCYKLELKEVKRVKQHLYRTHKKPIRCPRCQDIFANRASCDSHQEVDCARQPKILDEGINEDQSAELSNRGSASLTQEQRWFVVWQIVFPGVPEPASPYIDDDLSEDMCEFREFYQREGSTIILDYMRASGDWTQEDEERFRGPLWANVRDRALDAIHHRWLAQRAQAERSGSQATIQLATEPPGIEPPIDLNLDSPTSTPCDGSENATGVGEISFVGDPTVSGNYDSGGDWLYAAWQSDNTQPHGEA